MFLFSVVTLPVRTSAEDVPELGVEEDMWAKGEGSNTWIRETAQWGASLTFTDHQVSSGIIRYHQISGIIRYYQVSSGIIRYHPESPGIIRYYQVSSGSTVVIKLRKVGLAGHVARMGEMKNSLKKFFR